MNMKKCKYCQADLAENGTFCPKCGKDNAEEVAPEETVVSVPEEVVEAASVEEEATAPETGEEAVPVEENREEAQEEPVQIKEGAKATPGKIALAVVAVVALLALLIALLVTGLGGTEKPLDATESAATVATEGAQTTEPTIPATIPADGNPDDETCKGTYTASDEEVIAAADKVVATVGEYELTNSQLQVYYWLEVQNFLGNYGSYAYYFGLDYNQPLDTQVCGLTGTGTWQQYFLACALRSWQNYRGLAAEAAQNGFVLEEELQKELDALPETFAENAAANGFADAQAYLAYNVGSGAKLEDYYHFMELYYPGFFYFDSRCQEFAPSDEEIEAFFAENEAQYAENGITKDGRYVDVRHILVSVEGGTTDAEGNITYSDEAWETCRAAAQAILDEWLAGDKTEDSFAALANEKSTDPGSNTNGGLYTDVTEGQMVQPFNDWCFDESRQYGDYGLVQTSYGYHVMFFVESRPIWKVNAETDLIKQMANDLLAEVNEKYPLEADYKSILLSYIDLGA